MPLFTSTPTGRRHRRPLALALLLRSPDVNLPASHRRRLTANAGYVRYALRLEKRRQPVAAKRTMRLAASVRGWACRRRIVIGEPVAPAPGPLEDALDLLKRSIEQGATVVAIGPYTNLHLLDMRYPGILAQAKLYLMGGYVYPPRAGFPQWQNEDDYNVQTDVAAARHVLNKASPTLIPLSITAETALRGDPPVLHAAARWAI